MTYGESIILGLIQGLAEFLPISSSGHLAVAQNMFGIESDKVLFFTVMLHVGTLISVFIAFRHDIAMLIKELVLMIKDLFTGKGLNYKDRPFRKLLLMIIVATIPTVIIALLFNDFFESLYAHTALIGVGFLITGVLLFVSERMGKNRNEIEKMNFRNAIFVGIMQGVAIYPGISRSGSTLVGGLFTGLKREFAVRFAFLISIPTILGSAVLEVPKAMDAGIDKSLMGPIIIGMIVAAVSGYIAIKAMIKLVSNKKLKYFSFYVWIIGVASIIFGIVKG